MLLNKANNEKMLRHIFIDLDNYKYYAKPCKFDDISSSLSDKKLNFGMSNLSAIRKDEISTSKHFQIVSDEKFYIVFNEKDYGFYIDKVQIEKDLKAKKLGETTIKSTIEELENNLFSEMINIVKIYGKEKDKK